MRFLLFGLVTLLIGLGSATAQSSLKIINFTADWCPNCQILNPRMDEAITAFNAGSIERIDLDMTKARRGGSVLEIAGVHTAARDRAAQHKAGYLWNWYGGVTGIAVVISADNGEPLTCFMRTLSTEDIQSRLRLALLLAEHGTPGRRKPEGPDCPPPMND